MNLTPPSAMKGCFAALLAVAVSSTSSCSPLPPRDALTSVTPDVTAIAELQRPDIPPAGSQAPQPSPSPPEHPRHVSFPIPEDALVVFTNAGNELAIFEPLTGAWNVLAKAYWTPYRFSRTGCELLIATPDSNLRWVDLKGHITQNLFEIESLDRVGQEPLMFTVLPSPGARWVGYWLGSGRPSNEIGFNLRYETQNLFTYSMDMTRGPHQVSTSGGAYVVEWSPTDEAVAFSDYDPMHVHQVFVAAPDGAGKRQLTQFLVPSLFDDYSSDYEGIQDIVWSPDSALVAAESLVQGNSQVSIRSALAATSSPVTLGLDDAHILWWIDNQSLLFSSSDGINRVDVTSGETALLVQMPTFEVEAGRFLPLAGTHKGLFMIGRNIYIFDIDLSTWGLLGKIPDPTYWPIMTTPAEFQGIATCPHSSLPNNSLILTRLAGG